MKSVSAETTHTLCSPRAEGCKCKGGSSGGGSGSGEGEHKDHKDRKDRKLF